MSACKHTVSGSFSLPSRGSFHRSLTVLYSIGHMVVFSLRRWSSFIPSGFLVSWRTLDPTGLWTVSRTGLLPCFVYLSKYLPLPFSNVMWSSTPRILLHVVWALPISLATTFGIVIYFLFLWVMRCFSSPSSLHYAMYLRNDTTTLLVVSSLIRISTALCLFAAPRSFSQLVTSFFGAMYQGILRKPFVAWSFTKIA